VTSEAVEPNLKGADITSLIDSGCSPKTFRGGLGEAANLSVNFNARCRALVPCFNRCNLE
jgi:hypothetical protein